MRSNRHQARNRGHKRVRCTDRPPSALPNWPWGTFRRLSRARRRRACVCAGLRRRSPSSRSTHSTQPPARSRGRRPPRCTPRSLDAQQHRRPGTLRPCRHFPRQRPSCASAYHRRTLHYSRTMLTTPPRAGSLQHTRRHRCTTECRAVPETVHPHTCPCPTLAWRRLASASACHLHTMNRRPSTPPSPPARSRHCKPAAHRYRHASRGAPAHLQQRTPHHRSPPLPR